MTDPFLTARELAGRLGVSAETVLRWTRRGELPAIRLPGGAIRYREAEVEIWIDRRAAPGRGESNHPGERRPARNLSGVEPSPIVEED
jgi:excisionase family DNA binding protein